MEEQVTDVLTDEQTQAVCLALLTSRGTLGATEDELELLVDWARQAVTMHSMLELVLHGVVQVDVLPTGEITFTRSTVN